MPLHALIAQFNIYIFIFDSTNKGNPIFIQGVGDLTYTVRFISTGWPPNIKSGTRMGGGGHHSAMANQNRTN